MKAQELLICLLRPKLKHILTTNQQLLRLGSSMTLNPPIMLKVKSVTSNIELCLVQ